MNCLRASGQKTIYFAGDTTYKPDYIVLNTGEANYDGIDVSLIMGTKWYKKCY